MAFEDDADDGMSSMPLENNTAATEKFMIFTERDYPIVCWSELLSHSAIHSLSTNTMHLRAHQSPLRWTNKPRMHMNVPNLNRAVLQIACDRVAVLFPNTLGEMQVVVWDFFMAQDTSTPSDPSLRGSIDDFRLLDATHFLVTSRSAFGSIRLCALLRSPLPDSAAGATHLATLHLPPTALYTLINAIRSDAGPVEAAHPRAGAPFAVHDDARLHVFTLVYKHASRADPRATKNSFFSLFVHQGVLVKYARRALAHESPLEVPWAEWGPRNTRLAYSPHEYLPRNWRRYIHGQRVIFPDGEIRGQSRAATILDFSRAAVSSVSSAQDALLLSSNTIRTADVAIFREDVTTYLPCVASRVALGRTYDTYMIYADGFMGVNTNVPPSALAVGMIYVSWPRR